MANVTFSIEGRSISSSRLDVTAGEFTFAIDEPEQMGGSNAGPSPIDYLLGALAGCLNVVGHMVAQEMGITIDALKIHIEGDLDPLAFLGKKSGVRPGYQEIRVRCDVKSEADAEKLALWMQVVEQRCPVSDNLGNATPVCMTARAA